MSKGRILIVDDEKGVREAVGGVLEDEDYEVAYGESGEECLELLARDSHDVVLLDVWLPGIDGLETLEELRRRGYTGAVVMISGHGSIETAVRAVKAGAFDFIEKPLSSEKTLIVVGNALERQRLQQENISLRERERSRHQLVGESEPIGQLWREIELAAPSHGRVFLFGENGTGKELVAHLIHAHSPRSRKPFVAMNCAAVPEELIESELFGHEKGSFTGAYETKKGKFELADEGTLFLDEIGDMSLKMQAKVLRVLQDQTFQPVGGTRTIRVNVRLIAATNKHIEEEIEAGSFRQDLYFRLNVIPIHVAPLRERKADVPLLVDHFCREVAREYGRRPKQFANDAMDLLRGYPWPGNVRELKNVVERVMIMVPSDTVQASDLSSIVKGRDPGRGGDPFNDFDSLRDARESFERQFIQRKLEENGWNITRTAEVLGLERSNLHRKLKAYGLGAERSGGD